jgi:hypothetical protein
MQTDDRLFGMRGLSTMSDNTAFIAPEALVLQLVTWVAAQPRTYRETMEAWRTSCPKLPAWEDARDSGFLEVTRAGAEGGSVVVVTAEGRAFLDRHA